MLIVKKPTIYSPFANMLILRLYCHEKFHNGLFDAISFPMNDDLKI